MFYIFSFKWLLFFLFRRIYYKFFGYRRPKIKYAGHIHNLDDSNSLIYEKILKNEPFLVSRLGGVETDICFQYCLISFNLKFNYSNKSFLDGKIMAGIFPPNTNTLNSFAEIYIGAISKVDIIGTWQDEREKYLISKGENIITTSLENLEPFFSTIPWTRALINKRVLIVHPFIHSIRSQLNKPSSILFTDFNEGLLPSAEYILYKPLVSNGDVNYLDYPDWIHGLNKMKNDIIGIEFDVAIVAAGAYGLPLSAYIKELGKPVVHLAGATQLLFGIIGSRWVNLTNYKNLINLEWIRPLVSDVDHNIKISFQAREGGGYW